MPCYSSYYVHLLMSQPKDSQRRQLPCNRRQNIPKVPIFTFCHIQGSILWLFDSVVFLLWVWPFTTKRRDLVDWFVLTQFCPSLQPWCMLQWLRHLLEPRTTSQCPTQTFLGSCILRPSLWWWHSSSWICITEWCTTSFPVLGWWARQGLPSSLATSR